MRNKPVKPQNTDLKSLTELVTQRFNAVDAQLGQVLFKENQILQELQDDVTLAGLSQQLKKANATLKAAIEANKKKGKKK